MIQNRSLLDVLKKPASAITALAFAFLFFDVQYYIMSKMIGYKDLMCVPGAGLNTQNIIFAIVLSLMAGAVLVGFYATIKMRQASYKAVSASGIGALVGTFTVFCPVCSLPIFAAMGVSVGFTVDYNIWMKLLSLVMMSYAIYQINLQLKGECERCID